jgi:hypothetical protein
MEHLALTIDVEGRRLFLVERAERLDHSAFAGKSDIGVDHIRNIRFESNIIQNGFGYDASHGTVVSKEGREVQE